MKSGITFTENTAANIRDIRTRTWLVNIDGDWVGSVGYHEEFGFQFRTRTLRPGNLSNTRKHQVDQFIAERQRELEVQERDEFGEVGAV